MFSLIRHSLIARLALGGAAGTMLVAGAIATSPIVSAAAPRAAAETGTAAPHHADKKHGDKKHGKDRKSDRALEVTAYLDSSAAIMKMDPKDLRAALKSGHSMEEIAAGHGFATRAAFADAVSKAVKTRLDADVDAKKLTRAEADRFQDRLAHGKLPFWVRHHRK